MFYCCLYFDEFLLTNLLLRSVLTVIACMLDEIKTTSNHIIDNEQIWQNYNVDFLLYYMLWIVRRL